MVLAACCVEHANMWHFYVLIYSIMLIDIILGPVMSHSLEECKDYRQTEWTEPEWRILLIAFTDPEFMPKPPHVFSSAVWLKKTKTKEPWNRKKDEQRESHCPCSFFLWWEPGSRKRRQNQERQKSLWDLMQDPTILFHAHNHLAVYLCTCAWIIICILLGEEDCALTTSCWFLIKIG